jgi:hypothetical protein
LWLKLVIIATWEAEFRRIMVRGQAGQIVLKTPTPKSADQKDWRCFSSSIARNPIVQTAILPLKKKKEKFRKGVYNFASWSCAAWGFADF